MAILKTIITCTGPVQNAVVSYMPWKFGKIGFIALEFDDGTPGARKMMDVFMMNTMFRFLSYTYTDGCGNDVFYRTALALNGNFEEGQPGYDPTYITPAKLKEFIALNGDLINHTYVHGGDSMSRHDNLTLLEESLYRATGYKFNGIAVPGADQGFAVAGQALGYAYMDSQNGDTFDGGQSTHKLMSTTYTGFLRMVRDFNDVWVAGGEDLAYTKSQIDLFQTGQRNFWIEGTHSGLETTEEVEGYIEMVDYIKDHLGDTIAVGPVREFVEYQQMKNCPTTVTKSGNTITVSIDTANLSDRVRWQDVSLNVTGATISNVAVEGFTSSSFNPTTGLVNALKQKTDWSNIVPPVSATRFKVSRRFRIG
jgi:hypothetical protein